jgi:hypothetical protein
MDRVVVFIAVFATGCSKVDVPTVFFVKIASVFVTPTLFRLVATVIFLADKNTPSHCKAGGARPRGCIANGVTIGSKVGSVLTGSISIRKCSVFGFVALETGG